MDVEPCVDVDVAVVGAGPAGATAARVAARRGARVCVLERAAVPRYKTCGGGLVGLSADHVGIDLKPLEKDRVDRITVTLSGRYAITRGHSGGPALVTMVMRDELDAALLDAARAAGARVRTRAVVTALEESADGWVRLRVRGGPDVRARAVVGADGSAGRTGAYVGVTVDQVDLGLEGEFPAGPRLARLWAGRMLLDWGPVPGSYGWLFPKGNVLTVGVIGAKAAAPELRVYYRQLVERLGLGRVSPVHDTGHLTRVRTADSPLRRGRVIVAGDAAGLLDPWTREGISFALRSGRLAGEAAAAALGDSGAAGSGAAGSGAAGLGVGGSGAAGSGALDGYAARVAAVLGPEMDAGREVLGVFARHPSVMHGFMGAVPGGFGLFGRIVAGRSTVARQLRRPGVRPAVTLLSR